MMIDKMVEMMADMMDCMCKIYIQMTFQLIDHSIKFLTLVDKFVVDNLIVVANSFVDNLIERLIHKWVDKLVEMIVVAVARCMVKWMKAAVEMDLLDHIYTVKLVGQPVMGLVER